MVTWYSVLIAGDAVGVAVLTELNPVAGLHRYEVPPEAAKFTDPPTQKAVSTPAVAAERLVI